MLDFVRENGGTILFLGMISALMLAAVWEMLSPRRPEADGVNRRWFHNIGLAVINQVNVNWFTAAVTTAIALWADEQELGILRNYDLGFLPMLVIATLIFEFIAYWFHRMLHAVPWMWRIHAVHHSDTEVDFTTTYRNHPLELFVIAPLTVPPVLALGFSAEVVVAYQLLRMSISIVAHGNIRWSERVDGVLRYFIVTPDYHRVHHSSDQPFTDSNFSAAFPLYDYIFGTAKKIPYAAHPTMELGLDYFRAPEHSRIDRLLLMPFIWRPEPRTRAPLVTDGATQAETA